VLIYGVARSVKQDHDDELAEKRKATIERDKLLPTQDKRELLERWGGVRALEASTSCGKRGVRWSCYLDGGWKVASHADAVAVERKVDLLNAAP
jgi:hypothetical protein